MSGARTSSRHLTSEPAFIVPFGSPEWCSELSMGEAEARNLIKCGNVYTVGPHKLLKRKKYAVAVERRRADGPYVTIDSTGLRRGIYASWSATAAAMVALAIEFEERRG